jgi:hypothetical protein
MTDNLRMHYILVSAKSGCLAVTQLTALLDRRTGHRSVGAVNAAVAGLGTKDCVAFLALKRPLASVGGHGFGFAVPTFRTGQHRSEYHLGQGLTPVTVDGKPASLVARVRASNETWESS